MVDGHLQSLTWCASPLTVCDMTNVRVRVRTYLFKNVAHHMSTNEGTQVSLVLIRTMRRPKYKDYNDQQKMTKRKISHITHYVTYGHHTYSL